MKRNIKIFLFIIFSMFVTTSKVMASDVTVETNAYFGRVINFIPGILYDGVVCNYSGDVGNFEFTKASQSDDYYVEMINANATSGSAVAKCSYTSKSVMVGNTVTKISEAGTDTFIFNIKVPETKDKFEVNLHRQFRTFVEMDGFISIVPNSGINELVLSGDLLNVFQHSNGAVACNEQSCSLNLKQNAPTGQSVGIIKYGSWEFEMTVNVEDEWIIYADPGAYGTCEFDSGWETTSSSSNFYQKKITGNTTKLPSCKADSTFGNRYMALEFVGWMYNKDPLNSNYNTYQSVDVCSTYYGKDNPYVGSIAAGATFAPADQQYSMHGNSIFYACYKKNGIGFNLLGASLSNDSLGIMSWKSTNTDGGVASTTYYKVFTDGTTTIKLPSEVNPPALESDQEFIGWAHNNSNWNGTNVEVLKKGGESVSVLDGLIYYPVFVNTKAETERQVTVYVGDNYKLELPSGFTCPNEQNDNYSISGQGTKCVIAGLKSTNGNYLNRAISGNSKTFTLKIQVMEGAYKPGDDVGGVVIGDGELILDPGNNEGNVSVKVPAACDKYLVGRPAGGTVKSIDVFKYENKYRQNGAPLVTYNGHIFTYYARSNCAGDGNHTHETEYAALCLDPGRASPPKSLSRLDKNNQSVSVSEYKFYRYINVNDKNEAYKQFSRAVAFVINDVAYMTLAEFNQPNNEKKIAANIALRIIATQYDELSLKPDEGSTGNEEDDNGTVYSYYNAHNAYQTMAWHLNGRVGYYDKFVEAIAPSADKCVRELSNGQVNHERSKYMSCNEEWTWTAGTENIQKYVANYLSYAYQRDYSNDSWEITPTVKIKSREGDKVVLTLTYPRSIKFRYGEDGDYSQYGNYDITLNISEEMAKVYQINEEADYYNTNKHLSCIKRSDSTNKCVRYGVYLKPDLSPQDDKYARHDISLNFVIDQNADFVFPDANSRDIYLEVGYSSNYTSESAFMVEPINNANSVQRMILFNPEKVTKVFPIAISDCNMILQQYGNDSSYFERIYKAGCCETISDDSTEYQAFVAAYCKRDCVMNNYKPICESSDGTTDYKIKEGMTKNGNVDYSCVVDITPTNNELTVQEQLNMIAGTANKVQSAYANTSAMTDLTGENSIAISAYNNNPYCRVTCKEDWEFNMPGYNDFIGANAVAAGSVFQINNSINLKSSVTCVTSYIDIQGYKSAVSSLTNEIYNAYKEYSLRAAAHKDIVPASQMMVTDKGTWYTYTVSSPIACGTTEFNYNSYGRASSKVVESCGVTGNYTYTCKQGDWGIASCRKGNYNETHQCNSHTLDKTGCSVTGEKTVSGQYVSCSKSDEGNDGCSCSAGQHPGQYTCMKPKKEPCTSNDVNVSGCSVTGTYQAPTGNCATSAIQHSGCYISGNYTSGCSMNDLTSSGFVTKYNSDGTAASTGCQITGKYRNVDQTTHSGNSSCIVYGIKSPTNTKVKMFNSVGTNVAVENHLSISGTKHGGGKTIGYAETHFKEGSDNVCNGNSKCKIKDTEYAYDYECETRYDRNSPGNWRTHLIDNHTLYGNDTSLIKDKIEDYHELLNTKQETLTSVMNKFAVCQNFNVNNDNAGINTLVLGDGKLYSSSIGDVLTNTIKSSYNIKTVFNPAGSFGYDEEYYMGLMGDKREIAPNGGVSTSTSSGMYSVGTGGVGAGFKSCYGSTGKYVDASGNMVDCSSTIGSTSLEINGPDFGASNKQLFTYVLCDLGTLNYDYDANDRCSSANFYHYNANYVKKTLNSSGNYDNKVTWYRYLVNDTLYPGIGFASVDTKKSAADRLQGVQYVPEQWTLVGTRNVFPVSLNTRRNIYQYYYSFKGIGNYYNNSQVDRKNIGRIMGYDDSVVKSNSRVCFYEVYESACICCGNNELGPVSSSSQVNSYQYVSGYKQSSFDRGSGQYGFTASSVSLYNLDGFSSNAKGKNWQAGDHYFYNGKGTYTTDKGKELADYIEAKGENAYAETPEYSYVLTPNAMANIRKLNSSAKYGYGKDTVYQDTGYTYLVHDTDKDHSIGNTNVADKIVFTHFGSKFVKEQLADYETPEYRGKLLSSKQMTKDCYVEKGNVNSLNTKKNCKWVDYVQSDGSSGYFRMAFK